MLTLTYSCSFLFVSCLFSAVVAEIALGDSDVSSKGICPAEYELEGPNCVYHFVYPPKSICHGDSVLVDGICVNSVSPTFECPDNYIYSKLDKRYRIPTPFGRRSASASDACVKMTTSPLVADCPPNYTLSNGDCIIEESYDPVCPEGFLPDFSGKNDKCYSYSRPLQRCPDGFTVAGMLSPKGKNKPPCHRLQTAPAAVFCNEGFFPKGDFCVKQSHMEARCPEGSEQLENDVCAFLEPILLRCSEGFTISEDHQIGAERCFKKTVVDTFLECDKGLLLVGNQCISTFVLEPQCPHGSQSDSSINGCIRIDRPVLQCPPGFTLNSANPFLKEKLHVRKAVCTREVVEKPVLTCPEDGNDWAINEITGTCVRKELQIPVCPSGTLISRDERNEERCVHPSQPEFRCPKGFLSVHGGKCKQTVYSPLAKACAVGFNSLNIDGEQVCEKVVTTPLKVLCPKGWDYLPTSASCVFYHSLADPVKICPKEFYLFRNRCVHTNTKCGKGEFDSSCDVSDVDLEKNNLYVEPELSCPRDKERTMDNRCGVLQKTAAQVKCVDSSSTVIGNICKQVLHQPPALSCPHGFQRAVTEVFGKKTMPLTLRQKSKSRKHSHKGVTCVSHVFDIPMAHCAFGASLIDGTCIAYVQKDCGGESCEAVVTQTAIEKCPHEGYPIRKGVGTSCVTIETAPPTNVCMQGIFEEGLGCRVRVAPECVGGSCEKMVAILPNMSCPPGFSLEKVKEKKTGRNKGQEHVCVKMEAAVPNVYCGSASGIVNSEANRCIQKVARTCGDKGCVVVTKEPYNIACPDGYDKKYISDAKKSIVKSDHYLCTATLEAGNEEYCLPPATLMTDDGGNLSCASHAHKVCPKAGCRKVYKVAARWVCPRGYARAEALENTILYPRSTSETVRQDGGACITKSFKAPVPQCRVPFSLDTKTHMCVSNTQPQKICLTGKGTDRFDEIQVTSVNSETQLCVLSRYRPASRDGTIV